MFLGRKKGNMRGNGRQAGLTLAESLMVIAVGSVAIVSGTLLFQNAMDSVRVQDAVNALQSLRSEVTSIYGGMNEVGNSNGEDITQVIIDGGLVPAHMDYDDHLEHFWDGHVEIIARGSHFDITFYDLPAPICVQLYARTSMGNDSGGGLSMISINGSDDEPPYDPVFASNACNGLVNTVTWRFRK